MNPILYIQNPKPYIPTANPNS